MRALSLSAMEIASARSLASRRSGACTSSVVFPSSRAAQPVRLSLLSSQAAPRSSLRSQCSFGATRVITSIRSIRSMEGRTIPRRTIRASSSEAAGVTSSGVAETWLLQPIGDGDSRHIGFKVERPGAYEIVSDEVTVGRVPERADMVIPVATVSGLHARLEKKGRNLLVTDLDSTNGTYINEKRLIPGVAAPVFPGNRITFGDTHLAIFLVSKLEVLEAAATTKSQEPEEAFVTEGSNQSAG